MSKNVRALSAGGIAVALLIAGLGAPAVAAPPSTCTVTIVRAPGQPPVRYSELQPAIDAAPSGATLAVKGVCNAPRAGSDAESFRIAGKTLRIRGTERKPATLQGPALMSVVDIDASSTVELAHLIVTGGGGGGGAGISNTGSLTLVGVTVRDNVGGGPGGISNGSGSLTIRSSTISNNRSGDASGGGIANDTGTVVIIDSVLVGNGAYHSGGAIANGTGSITINRTTISDSRTLFYGAAIHNSGGTVSIADSVITRNAVVAGDGGGIYNGAEGVAATLSLNGVTISSNSASGIGGGLYNATGSVTNGGCPPATTYLGNVADGDATTNDHFGISCP